MGAWILAHAPMETMETKRPRSSFGSIVHKWKSTQSRNKAACCLASPKTKESRLKQSVGLLSGVSAVFLRPAASIGLGRYQGWRSKKPWTWYQTFSNNRHFLSQHRWCTWGLETLWNFLKTPVVVLQECNMSNKQWSAFVGSIAKFGYSKIWSVGKSAKSWWRGHPVP